MFEGALSAAQADGLSPFPGNTNEQLGLSPKMALNPQASRVLISCVGGRGPSESPKTLKPEVLKPQSTSELNPKPE